MGADDIRQAGGGTDHRDIIETVKSILEPWVQDEEKLRTADEQTHLITDLGLDSIGVLQAILGIEKAFDISIAHHELDSNVLSKLGAIAALIEGKINENRRFT